MHFKLLATTAFLMSSGLTQAFTPQAGTWIVNSELDGKPGRGLAIDVQKDTFVMQMYAYERTGEPTFYLATGKIANDQVSTSLMRYSSGRYLGSGPLSGKEAGNAGTVNFRFTSDATGFITLPGEQEKEISRFNFGYPFEASSLKGIWSFTSIDSQGRLSSEAYNLTMVVPGTADGNGLVMAADRSFACEHNISGIFKGLTLCIKMNTKGIVEHGYFFKYTINEGEGTKANPSGIMIGETAVRRLTNSPTGVMLKSSNQSESNSIGLGLAQKLSDFADQIIFK